MATIAKMRQIVRDTESFTEQIEEISLISIEFDGDETIIKK